MMAKSEAPEQNSEVPLEDVNRFFKCLHFSIHLACQEWWLEPLGEQKYMDIEVENVENVSQQATQAVELREEIFFVNLLNYQTKISAREQKRWEWNGL